jgi:type III pantothenate kinase
MSGIDADAWLFDLGNTRLKWTRLTGGEDPVAFAHGARADAVAQADLPRGDVAHVACVAASPLRDALLQALAQRFARIHVARTLPRCGGLRIAYEVPERLGVDRFLSLLAAHRRGGDALVVSVGTALTLDLVDAAGRHHGGRIAPSPALMREALHGRAAHLPEGGGVYAEFAADTADALASGCDGAALALVERTRAQARDRLGHAPALLLHGGGAASLASRLPGAVLVPNLVLEGLAQWARLGAGAG